MSPKKSTKQRCITEIKAYKNNKKKIKTEKKDVAKDVAKKKHETKM
jgi:hypothetical protein